MNPDAAPRRMQCPRPHSACASPPASWGEPSTRGTSTQKWLPSLSAARVTLARPPMRSIPRRTIASPMPVPGCVALSFSRSKTPKIRSSCPGGTPTPLSSTQTRTKRSRSSARMRTSGRRPAGTNRAKASANLRRSTKCTSGRRSSPALTSSWMTSAGGSVPVIPQRVPLPATGFPRPGASRGRRNQDEKREEWKLRARYRAQATVARARPATQSASKRSGRKAVARGSGAPRAAFATSSAVTGVSRMPFR